MILSNTNRTIKDVDFTTSTTKKNSENHCFFIKNIHILLNLYKEYLSQNLTNLATT